MIALDDLLMTRQKLFTDVECKAFVEAANPHQWVLTADSLHEQAVALYRRRKEGGLLILHAPDGASVAWDNTNKATLLLCAFALENAIKAFLVYEHPAWVSGGYLHPEITSHRLVQLSGKSTMIPYQRRDEWVLAAFEDGNDSWMRYPCGRRADCVQSERQMTMKLWAGYERVMRGYGTKLMRLLGQGWEGPHGWKASWEMRGDFLGAPNAQGSTRVAGRIDF